MDTKLKDQLDDVLYEWEQFNHCVDRVGLFPEKPVGVENRDKNVYLTALVIHARNLIHFFYENRAQDDIMAFDYYVDWESVCPLISPLLDDTRKRTHKLAAHITASRRTINRYWEWTNIRGELKIVWATFERYVPEARDTNS